MSGALSEPISLKSLRRNTSASVKPSITAFYAPHGIGKTSFAAGAPAPIFIQTEEGLGTIEADTFGLLRSYDEVEQALLTLRNQPHDFRTAILDSAGWLEPLIWDKVRKDNKWTEEKFQDYGRGYKAALNHWRTVFDLLSDLRNMRGMGVVILTHADTKKIEPPDMESYTQYVPKLHESAMKKLNEYVDEILFMNWRVSVVKEDDKDKHSRKMGKGGGRRVVYTTGNPAWIAKNRWNMPVSIDMPDRPENMFVSVAQFIPYYRNLMVGAEGATNTAEAEAEPSIDLE